MRTALVWIAVLAGCGGTRSKADEAYANGNYLGAQELYDKVARDNPNDHDAVARRDLARNAYLRVVLVQVQTAQTAHSDAAAPEKLLELVERRDGWQLAVAPHGGSIRLRAPGVVRAARVRDRARDDRRPHRRGVRGISGDADEDVDRERAVHRVRIAAGVVSGAVQRYRDVHRIGAVDGVP